jgi:hypothetical protein
MDKQKSIKETIKPIMQDMVKALAYDKPDNVVSIPNQVLIYDQLASKIWILHL